MQKETPVYVPINCSFHDVLLDRATLAQVCELVFHWERQTRTERAIITDVFSREGAEYLQLNNGLEIRLDYLISVDDFQLAQMDACIYKRG
ncbi:MAG: hypothetical protein AAGD05_07450 [Bacteroidota bacterium]